MHQENNNQGHVETRPETPPWTPVSAKPTLSSQTSTGKSGYNRKFNQKWLATPSSTGGESPVSKYEPSTQSAPTSPSPASALIGSIPSGPNTGPSRPISPYSPPTNSSAPSHVEERQTTASSHHYGPYPSYVGSYYTQTFGEEYRQPANPDRYYATTLLGSTAIHQATFQTSPSPQTNVSPPYGGEAHHRMPTGINPSPQAYPQPGCPQANPQAGYPQAYPQAAYPQAYKQAGYPQAYPQAGYPQAYKQAGYPQAYPKAGRISQAIVPVAPSVPENAAVPATPQGLDVQAAISQTSSTKRKKLQKSRFRRSRDGVT